MRVAVGQIAPLLGRMERNLERCLQVCEDAARAGCELLVLPECALSGYLFERREEAAGSACRIRGSATEAIAGASRELGLVCVVGLLEQDGVGLRNSALAVSPSGVAACYRCRRVEFLTRARAFENRVYLLLANRVGQERDAVFCGRSQVVAPDGSVLAEAGSDEELLVAEIDPACSRGKDVVRAPGVDELHLFADRRPELYGSLVRGGWSLDRPPMTQATASTPTG